VDSTTYSQFSRSIHERFSGKRAPLEVSIELTHRCPLQCLHCYNNLSAGDHAARARELSTDEHFRLLDELADLGCFWVLYTGGEIFARKDFIEIYTYAKKKGFLITLFTNGVLIDEAVADYLAEWPPFAIEITVYGRTRETYEALTTVSGSYVRCMRAIELLRERRLPLKLKTVCTTVNKHEVHAMKRFAEEELHTEFKFDAIINARIDCSQSPLAVRLSPEEVVALDLSFPKVAAEYRAMAERDNNQPPPLACNDHVVFCGGGMYSFAVDPYGRMSICVLARREMHDIRESGLRQGWEEFLLRVRTQKRKRTTKCVNCRLLALCGMCSANGELENGDAESPVDFYCEVAHLRTIALGAEVPAHGDCQYCAGGSQYARLQESARRIASKDIDVESWTGVALPVVNSCLAAETDCPGCASKRAGV
jgi:radical SAM protein with 4Fe4S-binding SPASM domain